MCVLDDGEFLRDGLYDQFITERNEELLNVLNELMSEHPPDRNVEYACMMRLREIINGKYNPPYCTIMPQICKKADNDNLTSLRDRISKIGYSIDRIIDEGAESQDKYGITPEFQKNYRAFSNSIILEIDHCIAMNEMKEKLNEYNAEYKRLSADIETFRTAVGSDKAELQNSIKESKDEIKSNKVDSVLVLSIFSAVALTFTGGLGLIGSAFSSIGNAPLNEVLTVILIVGFVMFNTIYVLLNYCDRIIRRHDRKDEDSDSIWHRHAVPICVNLVLVLMLLFCWASAIR